LEVALDGRGPIRRLEAAAEAYLDFALDQPQLYELVFLTSRRNLRRFPREFAAGRSRTGEMLRRQVEECMKTGAFAADDPRAGRDPHAARSARFDTGFRTFRWRQRELG
jgi:WHG domain-containing protein